MTNFICNILFSESPIYICVYFSRTWETRERRKAKEYDKEREKERLKEEERERDAKRLKEFLEDYDDERDDAKYYKLVFLIKNLF